LPALEHAFCPNFDLASIYKTSSKETCARHHSSCMDQKTNLHRDPQLQQPACRMK
jgi:hypothetical protein